MAKKKTARKPEAVTPDPFQWRTDLIRELPEIAKRSAVEAACTAAMPLLNCIEVLQNAVEFATVERINEAKHNFDALELGTKLAVPRLLEDLRRADEYLTDAYSALSHQHQTAVSMGKWVAESYTELASIIGCDWLRNMAFAVGSRFAFDPIGCGHWPEESEITGEAVVGNWGEMLKMSRDNPPVDLKTLHINIRKESLRATGQGMLRHDELHKKFSSVVGDEIIAILRSKGTRLKTDAILSAYFAKYGSDSSSTIKPKLSEMVKLGTLTSLRGTGGGYGLPEWT